VSSKRPFCIFGITQSKINRLEWLLIHRIPKKCCISDLYPVHLNNVTTVPCEMQILCICIGTAFWTSCRKWPPQARRFCDVHNKCPSPVQRVMNRESWSTLRGCFFVTRQRPPLVVCALSAAAASEDWMKRRRLGGAVTWVEIILNSSVWLTP